AIVVDVAGQFQLVTVVDDIVGVDLKNENLRPYQINDLLNEQHFLERAVTGGAIGKNLRRRETPLHERIVGLIIRDLECSLDERLKESLIIRTLVSSVDGLPNRRKPCGPVL